MSNYQHILAQAKQLILDVGGFIQTEARNFDYKLVEHKGLNDLVSYVDKTAEQKLVAGLSSIIPGCGFIAEEGTASHRDEEFIWIVDPLDGTTNFTHGLPVFAISVALMHHETLVLAMVYEVNKEELFWAIKGQGAFCNDKPIQVSERARLSESLIATGFPYNKFEETDNYLKILKEFMLTTHGIRRLGSAAVDLCYVACGRFEGFYEYNLSAWDVAAGILIVQEAGGQVSDFQGGPDYLFGKQIIAAGKVHDAMQQTIKKHWVHTN